MNLKRKKKVSVFYCDCVRGNNGFDFKEKKIICKESGCFLDILKQLICVVGFVLDLGWCWKEKNFVIIEIMDLRFFVIKVDIYD